MSVRRGWPALAVAGFAGLSGCTQPAEVEPKAEAGRWVIAQSSDQLGKAILLDTATGQPWYQQSSGPDATGDVSVWLPMDKMTGMQWIELVRPPPPKK